VADKLEERARVEIDRLLASFGACASVVRRGSAFFGFTKNIHQ
jgi:hypothetical protein